MESDVLDIVTNLSDDIRETYRFSLFPTSELYKEPEEIADLIGGGIQYDNRLPGAEVCRCGNGFLIRIPETEQKTMTLKYFAQGLAILFLKMKYEISEEDFFEFENMKMHSSSDKLYQDFADEMLCPLKTIGSIIDQQTRYGDSVSSARVSEKTGLEEEYIIERMKDYKNKQEQ